LTLKNNGGEANQESRYETLRQVTGVIASQADLNGVLENLARFLASVLKFEFLGVVLHDAERLVFGHRSSTPAWFSVWGLGHGCLRRGQLGECPELACKWSYEKHSG